MPLGITHRAVPSKRDRPFSFFARLHFITAPFTAYKRHINHSLLPRLRLANGTLIIRRRGIFHCRSGKKATPPVHISIIYNKVYNCNTAAIYGKRTEKTD